MTKQQQISSDYKFAEALPNAIIVLDEKNGVLWWNRAAGKLFSLNKKNHHQSLITDVITQPEFSEFLFDGVNADKKLLLSHRKHSWLTLSLIPYGETRCLLIADDITHTHQLERMRQDFVANVSHELRTPLTVVKGYLEALSEQALPDKEMVSQIFDQMHQQTTRMENLITDLLLLSHLETELPEEEQQEVVEVAPLLLAICDDARRLSGDQKHQIISEVDDTLKLYGRVDELRSAFSNLVVNAVRYTPAGGLITVRWFSDEDGAHMQVCDTGIGIAAKYIPRLTERFYRVDKGRSRMAGGTGLGLAIVKHVLIRHHAELKVTSKLSEGSVFQCDFSMKQIIGSR